MTNVEQDVSERSRRYWDEQAPRYDRSMDRIERFAFGDGRPWVCRQARGRALEVAIGTGRNIPLYPDGVDLVGVDLSPRMLDIARKRATDAGRTVELCEGNAQQLPFPDASFDTVVCTLGLCTVPDVDVAVGEMRRVLRPDGTLLLLDHVRPAWPPVRWIFQGMQWVVNRFDSDGNEQFLRRPLENVAAGGFRLDRHERYKAGAVERLVARKPA